VRQIVGAGIDGEDQFVQITESSFDFFHAQQNCAVTSVHFASRET
jgi:hypothetical protein